MNNDAESDHLLTTVGWDLNKLHSEHDNFQHVPRIHAGAPMYELLAKIDEHERTGVPLVIEGFHTLETWPSATFSLETLQRYSEHENINVRDVRSRRDFDMSLHEFIAELGTTPSHVQPGETRRLYGKDYQCPRDWADWLGHCNSIPSVLLPHCTRNAMRNLPDPSEIETLMCYIGVGDTFTPSHKDLCASSGQNLMVYTSDDHTSSYWFMTAGHSAPEVTQHFHEMGFELALESNILSVEQWSRSPFNVYILEQKLGDFVLVPSRSCHQVVNNGKITAKMSWSRMTVAGLVAAFYHELPIYHRICRPETYRIRATVYHSLLYLTKQLTQDTTERQAPAALSPSRPTRRTHSNASEVSTTPSTLNELRSLLTVFDSILVEEYTPSYQSLSQVQTQPDDLGWGTATLLPTSSATAGGSENKSWHCTCDFCGADIFQSCFECQHCAPDVASPGTGSGFLICAHCYAEGRSCKCGDMEPIQIQSFDVLLQCRNHAAMALQKHGLACPIIETIDPLPLVATFALPVFQSALVLHARQREDRDLIARRKKNTRQCTTRIKNDPAHPVVQSKMMSCKGCHAYKCFNHILRQWGIHSAEALHFGVDDDDKNASWHEHHLGRSTDSITMAIERVRIPEKRGSPCSAADRFVKVASQYRSCRPLDPKRTRLGWYDQEVSLSNIEDDMEIDESAAEPALANPSSVSADAPAENRSGPSMRPTTGPPSISSGVSALPTRQPFKEEDRKDVIPPLTPTCTPGVEPGTQLMERVLVHRPSFSRDKNVGAGPARRRSLPPITHLRTNSKRPTDSGEGSAGPTQKKQKLYEPSAAAPSRSAITGTQTEVTQDKCVPQPQPGPNFLRPDRGPVPSAQETACDGRAQETQLIQETQPVQETLPSDHAGKAQSSTQLTQPVSDEPHQNTIKTTRRGPGMVSIPTPMGTVRWPRDKVKPSKLSRPSVNEDTIEDCDEGRGAGRPTTNQVIKTLKILKKKPDPPREARTCGIIRQQHSTPSTSPEKTSAMTRAENGGESNRTAPTKSTLSPTVSTSKAGPFPLTGLTFPPVGPSTTFHKSTSASVSGQQGGTYAPYNAATAEGHRLSAMVERLSYAIHSHSQLSLPLTRSLSASRTGSSSFPGPASLPGSSAIRPLPSAAAATYSARRSSDTSASGRPPFPASPVPNASSASRHPSPSQQVVPMERYQASQAENRQLKEQLERIERQKDEDRRDRHKRDEEHRAEITNTVNHAIRNALPDVLREYSLSTLAIDAGPSSQRPRDDQRSDGYWDRDRAYNRDYSDRRGESSRGYEGHYWQDDYRRYDGRPPPQDSYHAYAYDRNHRREGNRGYSGRQDDHDHDRRGEPRRLALNDRIADPVTPAGRQGRNKGRGGRPAHNNTDSHRFQEIP